MAGTDPQTYAQAIAEGLLSLAGDQLSLIAERLGTVADNEPAIERRLELACPPDTMPLLRSAIRDLARSGELRRLPDIVHAFREYAQGGKVALSAHVTSAISLTQEQQNVIAKDLQARYSTPLDLHFEVDETLLGGLIIRIGDQEIDTSLRTRLAALRQNMLAS